MPGVADTGAAPVFAEQPALVILDRDGTINVAAAEGAYIVDPEAVALLPGAATAIARLNRAGIPVAVATNQRCIALGLATSADVASVHARITELLAESGAWIDAWFVCPHAIAECDCRKPAPGLLTQAIAEFAVEPAQVVMIGDRESDVTAATRAGVQGVQLGASGAGGLSDLASAVEHLLVNARRSRRRWWLGVWGWSIALALVLLGPALAPGYVLNLDMVFTPHQPLLPWMFGLDGGLPRAVPQDVAVGLLAGPLSGAVVQKVALLAAFSLAGVGVARLLRGRPLPVALTGVTLYVWNAFVAERLAMGNWALLLTYAATPWLLAAVIATRRRQASGASVIGWAALGSLVPTGGVVMMVIAAALLLPNSAAGWRRRTLVVGGVGALNLPWILAAVAHPTSTASDPAGAAVFAVHPDGPWGVVITALSLGGTWNSDVVPASRGVGLGVLWLVVVATLAVMGVPNMRRVLTPSVFAYVSTVAAMGALLAILSATSVGTWVVGNLPGGGLLRDGQKPLALVALWLSLAAALGIGRLLRVIRSQETRRVVLAVAVVLPIVLLPDAAWAGGGRLAARAYPNSWSELEQQLGAGDAAVVSLPWSTFRRYEWNDNRSVVDPLPRFVDRTVVGSDELLVGSGRAVNGSAEFTVINGDDPRASAVAAAMTSGTPLAVALPPLGIGYAVVQTDQPTGRVTADLAGMTLVWVGAGLELWTTPVSPVPWVSDVPRAPVIAGFAAALLTMVAAGAVGIINGVRSSRRVWSSAGTDQR